MKMNSNFFQLNRQRFMYFCKGFINSYYRMFTLCSPAYLNLSKNSILKFNDVKSFVGVPILGNIGLGKSLTTVHVQDDAQLDLNHVSIGRGSNLSVFSNSKLFIGYKSYVSENCLVSCQNSIFIGSYCEISWEVQIIDNDGHTLNQNSPSRPITIGDRVWIGARCLILKGSQIGSGSVVAAGAVVSGKFPSNCLIGGVPAKIIKENITWS